MVKVAIRHLIDERHYVAVKSEIPDGLTEEKPSFLTRPFIRLFRIRRGSVASEPPAHDRDTATTHSGE